MSYARFGVDHSEVYVFFAGDGLECCGCILQQREWVDDPSAGVVPGYERPVGEVVKHRGLTTDEIIAHLQRHRDAGHHVPRDLLPLLELDRAENDASVRRA